MNNSEDLKAPQSNLLIESINEKLSREENFKGILSDTGRLNKEGRKLSDAIYTDFLVGAHGSYKAVLNICREAETLLYSDDPAHIDTGMLKIIRSIRGKVVYNAHKTWAENKLANSNFGDTSASNVMYYAKVFKKHNIIDVYEEASDIERKKQLVDEQLQHETADTYTQNIEILNSDFDYVSTDSTFSPEDKESIITGLKRTLDDFSQRILHPSTRTKIVVGALSAVSIASMLLGQLALSRPHKLPPTPISSPKVEVIFTPSIPDEASKPQTPSVITDANIYDENYLNSTTAEIPSLLNIAPESLKIVDAQHPIDEDMIKQEILPNLINVSEGASDVWLISETTKINKLCAPDLNTLFRDAHGDNIRLYLSSAFRDMHDQQLAYNQSPDKTAVSVPGTSQHHLGLAIDVTSSEINKAVDVNAHFSETNAGKWMEKNAWKYGFVLSYTNNHAGIHNEDWHYFYVGKDLAKIWHEHRVLGDTMDLFALQEFYGVTGNVVADLWH